MMQAEIRSSIRRLQLIGLGIIAILVGGIGSWAATADLSGAVIAPASIVVESNVKKVQHSTGGIVGEILVDEGSPVEAGQVLLRLDDTAPRTSLGIIRSELGAYIMRRARLVAERDGSPAITAPQWPADWQDKKLQAALAGEERLFSARRNTVVGQKAQLREQVTQLNEEIGGLLAQQAACKAQSELAARELEGVAKLFAKNLVAVDRRNQLERTLAELRGQSGRLDAEIAKARGRISEIELQILQVDKDFLTGVLDELRELEAKISELLEKQTAAEDQLRRIDIRSPQAGTVHELSVHTVGGIVGPGDTIMMIVPRADRLVAEIEVAPQDIDQVSLGSSVSVRILAGNQRTMQDLAAEITRISADLAHEPETGRSYYVARAGFLPETAALLEDFRLLPGMPAEVYIVTEPRTPLEYLMKPISEQVARAFRER